MYVNNKIKLFIVSATLDNDEIKYRRFYEYIKDSLMYPIKYNIRDPFTNRELKDVLKYLDRRYDITPIEMTDMPEVIEIYSKNKDLDIFEEPSFKNQKHVIKSTKELQEISKNAQNESYT